MTGDETAWAGLMTGDETPLAELVTGDEAARVGLVTGDETARAGLVRRETRRPGRTGDGGELRRMAMTGGRQRLTTSEEL